MYIIKALGNNLSLKQRTAADPFPPLSSSSLLATVARLSLFRWFCGCSSCLVQVVVRGLLWSSAGSKVADVDGLLGATPFDAQEALVRVSLLVAAAHRLVLLRTHSGASLEREGGQASLGGHDKDVLAAVLLPHMTLCLVELVVGPTDKAAALLIALGLTMRRHDAVLKGHGHHSQTTRLLLHLAHALVGVAIGSANGRGHLLLCGALGSA